MVEDRTVFISYSGKLVSFTLGDFVSISTFVTGKQRTILVIIYQLCQPGVILSLEREIVEFSLKVFTEFAEFSNKNISH